MSVKAWIIYLDLNANQIHPPFGLSVIAYFDSVLQTQVDIFADESQ